MTCDEARDLLIERATGSMPPDRRRGLDVHLRTCAACRAQAADVANTVAALRAAPDPHLADAVWAGFMEGLARRLQQETAGWRRVLRWLRVPRLSWSMAALAIVIGAALLAQPVPPVRAPSGEEGLRVEPFLAESVVQGIPSMTAALDLWKAGFTAADVSYDASGGGQ